jgi:hypothetical protein
MSDELRSEVLKVGETGQAVYLLTVDYQEGDSGHGVGTLYRKGKPRDNEDAPQAVLEANELLSCLWISPKGKLWVSSAQGRVATTAALPWSAAGSGDGAGYNASGDLHWVVRSLPAVGNTGLPPNVTALWGLDDHNVLAGTYGGHIFQWDGQSWRQSHVGPGKGNGTIAAFGGSGPNDVFAVGQQGTLLHFDGSTWRPIPVPGANNGHETFTAVHALPEGGVLISSAGDQGRLLQGTAQALTEFGRYDLPLIGMAALDDRVMFATGEGCAELVGRDVRTVKDSFMTVNVFPGMGRVFYIEPDQADPGFIDYDPREDEFPWWRQTF